MEKQSTAGSGKEIIPGGLSLGAWVILVIGLVSTGIILAWPVEQHPGLQMWYFSTNHGQIYKPVVAAWNKTHDPPVNLTLFTNDALRRRIESGFLADTLVPDLTEYERHDVPAIFMGPLEDIGFTDLTDILKKPGPNGEPPLIEQLNTPSFSPWSSRGHIFGLPHDVHPVLLSYRADIIEAAGIDMSKIETWDDFERVMRPLVIPGKQYPLNLWYTDADQIESLVLQAGGGYFNQNDELTIDTPINAKVIARAISWEVGPNRICGDAPEFGQGGNESRINGYILCSITPDWLTGIWRKDIPLPLGADGKPLPVKPGQYAGNLKVMPMPAWEKGGRRTGVWGGTMLGIPKATKNFDQAWTFAKYLYLSPEVATGLYQNTGIISPVKKYWSGPDALPCYAVPDPYFSNQPKGLIYISQAPFVPRRSSNPYNGMASERVGDAIGRLYHYAVQNNVYDPAELEVQCHKELQSAEEQVSQRMSENVFLKETFKKEGQQ